MNGITIAKFTEEDRADYVKMATAFYDTDAVIAPIPTEFIEKTADECLSGSPFATLYIAKFEGERAGYALLAHTYSQEAGGMTAWIEELFVKDGFKGKGIGTAMLKEILSAPDVKRFRLEVEEENERAVKLYKSLGFDFFPYDQMKKGN